MLKPNLSRPALLSCRRFSWGILLLSAVSLSPALAFGALAWETQKLELTAKPGEKQASGVYHFKNTGNTPVTITALQPTCGCTTAELLQKTYAPGESGEIRATFEFGDRMGPQEKTIQVVTDEAPAKPEVLVLKVAIPELFTCTPRLLLWRIGEAPTEKPVTFSPAGAEKVTGIEVNALVPADVTTRVEPMGAGAGFRLYVRPESSATIMTTGISCIVRFANGTSQPFVVNALVR